MKNLYYKVPLLENNEHGKPRYMGLRVFVPSVDAEMGLGVDIVKLAKLLRVYPSHIIEISEEEYCRDYADTEETA